MAGRSSHHSHLLAPGSIGSMRMRNRIVLPAMDQNSCTAEGHITELNIAHYEQRARGGTGLLVLETAAVAYPIGAASRHQPSLNDDACLPGLMRLTEACHRHGARVAVQLNHHGKTAGVDAIQDRAQIVPSLPLPPDDIQIDHLTMDELMKLAGLTGGKRPERREATVDDLMWIVEKYAEAAERSERAGFDAVEVQTGHGYLIATFLSPKYNRRTDDYGGSLEKRAKLMCDVIAAVRARCPDLPIIVRMDAVEYAEGGITLDDAIQHARLAVAAGADSISVSAMSPNALGAGFTDGPLPWSPGQYLEFTKRIKAAVTVPLIAVGRIMPDQGDAAIKDGVCDFVAMGRQLLADPDLANRLHEGRPDLVRTCINCYVCVAENFFDSVPVCAINAELGHYDRPAPNDVSQPRHIVVVGGGPGGMEAARVAADRGHRVTLVEKAPRLGGTALFSSLTTPMNGELVRYLSTAIGEAGVDVRLGTTATVDSLMAMAPDAIVVATGARRERPQVPGADLAHVLTGDDLRALLTGDDPEAATRVGFVARAVVTVGRRIGLTSKMSRVRSLSRRWMPVGRDIVVVGGGLVGVELAEFLAERGRRVTVLESSDKLGVEMAHPRRARALRDARSHGVRFEVDATLQSIDTGHVTYAKGDVTHTVAADNVIMATGVHPDTSLADALRERGAEVHVIGDAGEVGYIQNAIATGHALARSL
jgi:2,4-dienoyl-CoA reductase-like NADH-dependent reductase (Old Yellow Enzyme family)/NADPH-dependent 2,4-dienoyl-CoA reductase/sulfur reductase-like enzyme